MPQTREKFATQVNSEILSRCEAWPKRKAVSCRFSSRSPRRSDREAQEGHPRAQVMAAYLASHEKYAPCTKSSLNDGLPHHGRSAGHARRSDRALRRLPRCPDPGLLEAALFRPQTGYYADLIEEAAALWEACLKTTRSSTATNGQPSPPRTRFSRSTARGSGQTPRRRRILCSRSTTETTSPSTPCTLVARARPHREVGHIRHRVRRFPCLSL